MSQILLTIFAILTVFALPGLLSVLPRIRNKLRAWLRKQLDRYNTYDSPECFRLQFLQMKRGTMQPSPDMRRLMEQFALEDEIVVQELRADKISYNEFVKLLDARNDTWYRMYDRWLEQRLPLAVKFLIFLGISPLHRCRSARTRSTHLY
jgi:hypothetical protein